MAGSTDSILYRNCAPVADSWFGDGKTLVEALAHAVAAAEGVDPLDLPPLSYRVDLDTLSALFERTIDGSDPPGTYCFSLDHWSIFVRGDGLLRVCDTTRPTDPEPVFGEGVL